MSSPFEKKPLVLFFSILSLAALILLSVSLGGVLFNAAQPIGREEAGQSAGPPRPNLDPLSEVSLSTQILFLGVMVIILVLVGILISPETRKRVLRFIFRMAFTLWVLYFVSNRYPDLFDFLKPAQEGDARLRGGADALGNIPPPVFTPPQETSVLSYLISLLIVLGTAYLGWKLYRAWRELNQPSTMSLQSIARIARTSLNDLSAGRGAADVIMNCYYRMSEVAADRKNLRRRQDMTPAEFALRLEAAGLPGDAVRGLTRLFERVRYGTGKAEAGEVNEAVACLTTILQYCGESA
jgi:hypothetical protein